MNRSLILTVFDRRITIFIVNSYTYETAKKIYTNDKILSNFYILKVQVIVLKKLIFIFFFSSDTYRKIFNIFRVVFCISMKYLLLIFSLLNIRKVIRSIKSKNNAVFINIYNR